jgi:hypothetical protein
MSTLHWFEELTFELDRGVGYPPSVRWVELEEWCPTCRCQCAACESGAE